MQQVRAEEPVHVAIEHAAAEAHRRDARHIGAVVEGRAHEIHLIFDPEPSSADRQQVPLALKLAAAEGRVLLRIDRFAQTAAGSNRGATGGVSVAGLAGQPAEDEAVEVRVIERCFETEGADGAAQADFDRICDLDLEGGIAFVECDGGIVRSAGEQLGRLGRPLHALRRDACDHVRRQILDAPQ